MREGEAEREREFKKRRMLRMSVMKLQARKLLLAGHTTEG